MNVFSIFTEKAEPTPEMPVEVAMRECEVSLLAEIRSLDAAQADLADKARTFRAAHTAHVNGVMVYQCSALTERESLDREWCAIIREWETIVVRRNSALAAYASVKERNAR